MSGGSVQPKARGFFYMRMVDYSMLLLGSSSLYERMIDVGPASPADVI